MNRRTIAALLAVTIVLGGVFHTRRMVALRLYALFAGGQPALLDAGDEGPGVAWFDDYYTVEWIDPLTAAIGEPRYVEANYNYLILGSERALLFDSGPGVRDIRRVVASLTDLPVTAVPSHLHYDHIGNHRHFERIAVIGLPELRERAPDGLLTPTAAEHLGFVTGQPLPTLRVSEWLPPGGTIDLGDRELRILHVPGHTWESLALLDEARGQLFTGDYVTEGALFAFVPGASLGDYLATAEALVDSLAPETRLLTAHRATPPGAPILAHGDLVDLRRVLRGIRSGAVKGSGLLPRVFRVNDALELHSDFEWAERWPRPE